MDSATLNQILVVDSIPAGDLNTARRLYDDIKVQAVAHAPSLEVRYSRVENADELIELISHYRIDAQEKGIIPMLHIECHGDEDGFEFADGSYASWTELKTPITELNVATRLSLVIAVAACTGGALAKIMTMGDRAPFWGLIGPTLRLSAGELETAYRALYVTLLSTKSPAKAVAAMDAATKPGQFWRTTAQGLFEEVWAGYKERYCNAEALEMRAERMIKRHEQRSDKPAPTKGELKGRLISQEPKAFDRFRATFFMYDLFPEHLGRFPVKYVA